MRRVAIFEESKIQHLFELFHTCFVYYTILYVMIYSFDALN